MTPPQLPADRPAATAGPGHAAPTLTIDALGRKCPVPIIMLAERIREVPVGHVVAVLADDPAAQTDVPAWCMLKSHEFIEARDIPGPQGAQARDTGPGAAGAADLPGQGWAFLVRRSY